MPKNLFYLHIIRFAKGVSPRFFDWKYMIDPDLKLQKPLEDYMESLEKCTPRTVMLFENLVDIGFVFIDPYHRCVGSQAFQKLLVGRYELHQKPKYKIYDFIWGRREATAYIKWRYSFELPASRFSRQEKSNRASIEGMSELVFSGDLKLLSHTDFWGEHEDFNTKAYKLMMF